MKPSRIEKLEGCPGRRPLNEKEPQPEIKKLKPPTWLDSIGKRAFQELSKILGPDNMSVLAESDRLGLALICDAFSEYRNCKKLIGAVTSDKRYYMPDDGTIIKKHPAVSDMQDAWRRLWSALGKYGLTPYDRRNIDVIGEKEKKQESREEALARRRAEAAKKARAAGTKPKVVNA